MIRQIGSQHRRTTEHCMDPTEVIDRPSQNIAASRWATSQVGVRLRRLKVGSTVVPGSDPGGQQLWGHRLASMSAIEQVAWCLRDHVFVSERDVSETDTPTSPNDERRGKTGGMLLDAAAQRPKLCWQAP